MTHRSESTRSRLQLARWASLGAVVIALLVLVLLGSRLVQAGPPTETVTAAAALYAPGRGVTQPFTETVFMPLVFSDYPCWPLTGLVLAGPDSGTIGLEQDFTVTALPPNSWIPVTYTWQATGQAPIVRTIYGREDAASFTWDLAGTKVITVEAVNECGGVVQSVLSLEMTTRGMVAFERHEPNEPHDIWVVYHDAPELEINLTNTPDIDEGAPTWSPDGNWIAYAAAQGDANKAIYKMDLRTRAVTQLTDGTNDDRWPAWSPLGDRITFMRNIGQREIYVMDADGGNQTRITHWDGGDEFPAWSPDGQRIVFSSERYWLKRDLWTMDPDGGNLQIVLRTDKQADNQLNDEIYPTWGPDGFLYYTFKQTDSTNQLLFRIRPDGSQQQKVFNDDYNRYIASWSPDGQCFAFYSVLGDVDGTDKEVWKWCNGFTWPVNLTDNDIGDEFCAWSPVP